MPIEILPGDMKKFDSDFLKQLPLVEKAMLSRNINPSAFAIAKSSPRSHARYGLTSDCYDYTVTIGEESFTVTYPSDQSFLEFFFARCVADEKSRGLPGATNRYRANAPSKLTWFETPRQAQ
jgi:hypothetical protein